MATKFHQRIRELRIKNDLKQSDVAEILGIAVQSYSAYENGREPKYEIMVRLANRFNVSTDYLLGVTDVLSYNQDQKDKIINDMSGTIRRLENKIIRIEAVLLK